MKTEKANFINALVLIIMPAWAFFTFEATDAKPHQSVTAFIPLFFGVILLLCQKGIRNENKVIAHIAVLITLIGLLGLFMPFKAAISEGRELSIFRVGSMILTGIIAMIMFIKSFIKARKKS